MSEIRSYGVLARFATAEHLLAATAAARQAGFQKLDAYAPFPLPGLAQALGFRERRIPAIALFSGLLGSAGAFVLQWYSAVIDYPYVTGGKPLNSWPAFLAVTFEVGILATVVAAVIAMLVGNRLPKLWHPVFNGSAFTHASSDGFFLLICDNPAAAKELMREQQAMDIRELML